MARYARFPSWSLTADDPQNILEARVVLAMVRVTRRVRMSASRERYSEAIGRAIAPAVESLPAEFAAALRTKRRKLKRTAQQALAAKGFDDFAEPETDEEVFTWLGEALALGEPCFNRLFDLAEEQLQTFLDSHSHPCDRNVEMLSELVGLNEAETAFISLACALTQSIHRGQGLFDHIKESQQLRRSLLVLTEGMAGQSPDLLAPNRLIPSVGLLLERTITAHTDLSELLLLSAVGERALVTPCEQPEELAARVLQPLQAPGLAPPLRWPHLAAPQAVLESMLSRAVHAEGDDKPKGINILLYGPPGTGKTEFARQLVQRVGAAGFAVVDDDGDGEEGSRDDRLANLRLCQIFAGNTRAAVLLLDEAEDIFQNDRAHPLAAMFGAKDETKAWMNRLLETNRHPVIWISNRVAHLDPAYLRRFSFCLEFPRTPRHLRREMAEHHLGPAGCSPALIDAMADNEYIVPALLANAARMCTLGTDPGNGLSADSVVGLQMDGHLKVLGSRPVAVQPRRHMRYDVGYLNVAGNVAPRRLLDTLASARSKAAGMALLFAGASGTGKTQFAIEIAHALGRELVYRTAADINSKWYGESEANVAELFSSCDPETEVLFLDEAETLLSARDATGHRADRAVTAEFLRRLESFEGVFICATNHAALFDAALMRRFMFRLQFLPLDGAQRQDMFCETAFGWRPGEGGERPDMAPLTASRLARLHLLTPGDFANVQRRISALQLRLTAEQWLEELEGEHAAKPEGATRAMGFV